MDDSGRQRWLGKACFVGVLYLAVAPATAALAGAAASDQLRVLWRLSADVTRAVVLAAHIASEHFLRRNPARATAWHASVAAVVFAVNRSVTRCTAKPTPPGVSRPRR